MSDQLKLEECVSFIAAKTFQRINKRARELLKPLGVSPTQCGLLIPLWANDGQSSVELGDILKLDSATMTGLIDRCEALGIVQRRADETDRRRARIWLTDKGRNLEMQITKAERLLNVEVEEVIGDDTAAFLQSLLVLSEIKTSDQD